MVLTIIIISDYFGHIFKYDLPIINNTKGKIRIYLKDELLDL